MKTPSKLLISMDLGTKSQEGCHTCFVTTVTLSHKGQVFSFQELTAIDQKSVRIHMPSQLVEISPLFSEVRDIKSYEPYIVDLSQSQPHLTLFKNISQTSVTCDKLLLQPCKLLIRHNLYNKYLSHLMSHLSHLVFSFFK